MLPLVRSGITNAYRLLRVRYRLLPIAIAGIAFATIIIVGVAWTFSWFSWLPGVPSSDSPTAAGFSASFWSALYSGVLSSLVTGFVVGVALWIVETKADQRSYRRETAREVAATVERLRFEMRREPEAFLIGSNSQTLIPAAATAALQVLAERPLDAWIETLPDLRQLLERVRQFQRTHAAYMSAAAPLDLALANAVRAYNAGRGIFAVNDSTYKTYYLARLRGMEGNQILAWIDRGPEALQTFEDSFAALSADAGVKTAIQRWKEADKTLREALSALDRSLG